jgi:hypothetical protein
MSSSSAVQLDPLEGDLRVIESGLKPDDRVVPPRVRAIPEQKVDPQLRRSARQRQPNRTGHDFEILHRAAGALQQSSRS